MPEGLRSMPSTVGRRPEGELDRILAHLNRDTGWKGDTSKTPNILMKRDIDPLHIALERYAGTVDASDPKLATLKEKLAMIKKPIKKIELYDRTYLYGAGSLQRK